jgi:hypothetical protein
MKIDTRIDGCKVAPFIKHLKVATGGLVALYVRFKVGSQLPKPERIWTCSECKYLNESYALFCNACNQPWATESNKQQ